MITLSRRQFLMSSACALFAPQMPAAAQTPAIAPKGHRSRKFPEDTNSILWVSWSSDGKRIAAGGVVDYVWVWNVSTGRLEWKLSPVCSEVSMFSFSPDSKWLAVGGKRETRLYDLSTGKYAVAALEGFTGGVPLIAFSPDGKRIAAADEGGTLIFFDNMGLHGLRASEQGGSFAIAWSPDSKQVVIGDINKLRVFDASTGKLVWRWDETPNTIKSLAWSKDGTQIAFGCANNAIYLVDAVKGKQIRKIEGHHEMVHSIAFAAEDTRLLTADSKVVGVWEIATGKNLAFLTVCEDNTTSVAFSPDGKQCAVGGYTAYTTVYDLP